MTYLGQFGENFDGMPGEDEKRKGDVLCGTVSSTAVFDAVDRKIIPNCKGYRGRSPSKVL